jgi:hypothetical protein
MINESKKITIECLENIKLESNKRNVLYENGVDLANYENHYQKAAIDLLVHLMGGFREEIEWWLYDTSEKAYFVDETKIKREKIEKEKGNGRKSEINGMDMDHLSNIMNLINDPDKNKRYDVESAKDFIEFLTEKHNHGLFKPKAGDVILVSSDPEMKPRNCSLAYFTNMQNKGFVACHFESWEDYGDHAVYDYAKPRVL